MLYWVILDNADKTYNSGLFGGSVGHLAHQPNQLHPIDLHPAGATTQPNPWIPAQHLRLPREAQLHQHRFAAFDRPIVGGGRRDHNSLLCTDDGV